MKRAKDGDLNNPPWLRTLDLAYGRMDRFLTIVEGRTDIKDSVEYLRAWYDAYAKLMVYVGSASIGVLVFTSTFLLRDYATGAYGSKIHAIDLMNARRSIICFALSLLFVCLALVSTYNWFAHGLEYAIRETGVRFKAAGEQFHYRKRMGSMSFWGYISLLSGYAASIFLLVGFYFYIYAAWDVLTSLLQKQ